MDQKVNPPIRTSIDAGWRAVGEGKEDWDKGGPDGQSSGYASVIKDQLEAGKSSPQVYLMQRDGISRAQADKIVATCMAKPTSWDKFKDFCVRFVNNLGA